MFPVIASNNPTDANPGSDIMVPKGNIPAAGIEYIRKLRDVKYYETIMELIAKQFEMAKLDEARQGAIVQVVDMAVTPDKRSFPKRTLTVVLAIFVSFFAACAWCFLAYTLQRMKGIPEERQRLEALRTTRWKFAFAAT